ncbi:MAG: ADOP family duplicated permease [Gemmatimonadaceae bacterium]
MRRFLQLTSFLESCSQDVRFAVRTLRRSPGIVTACVVTIALGVGANGAMFSLVDRLFVRQPAGVHDPARIRRLYLRTSFSIGNVPRIEERFTFAAVTLLDSTLRPRIQLAAYTKPDTMPLVLGGASKMVHGAYVGATYMPVLGVQPAMGRFFAPNELVMGAPVYVAVLSHSLWERSFGKDASVIGRTVDINRQRTVIIGVAAASFDGPDLGGTDIWMPLPTMPAPNEGTWYKSYRAAGFLRVLGRVSPNTADGWVETAATTIVRRTRMGKTNIVRDSAAVVLPGPLLEALGPSITPPPEIAIAERLVGVTLIVLLIACANVANLLLARALGRRREIAVRLALGVSRGRLVRQFVIEGLLLSLVAAAAAILLSAWAGAALRRLVTPDTYFSEPVVDTRVVVFALFVALGTGLLSALAPALQATRPELTSALRSGARDGTITGSGARLRRVLLAAQVAFCVMLLYGAGLFVESLRKVQSLDLGFDRDRLVYATAAFVMPDGNYLDFGQEPVTAQRLSLGIEQAAAHLSERPEVESVALTSGGPMLGYTMAALFFRDGSPVPRLEERDPAWIAATPNYLTTTGLRLTHGSFFAAADRGASVVVVNETAAEAYWPGKDPIGQCVAFGGPTEPCATVIGVVHDARLMELIEPSTAQLLTPFGFAYRGRKVLSARYLIVRARPGQSARAVMLVRRELVRSFPGGAVPRVFTAAERLAPQLRPWRTGLTLFSAFGALALLVAAFGTYSVISYAVSQRAHEMSVRVALGARAADLMRLVLGEATGVAATGISLGVVVSLAFAHVLQALLYETGAHDPFVMCAVAALLGLVVIVASAIPAGRATRADPIEALRAE